MVLNKVDKNPIKIKPQNQKKCRQCNKVLPNNVFKKVWYLNKYEYFCSDGCIENKNVEYVDCTICNRFVTSNCKAICCDNCSHWVHLKCSKLSEVEFSQIYSSDASWFCGCCYKDIFLFLNLMQGRYAPYLMINQYKTLF